MVKFRINGRRVSLPSKSAIFLIVFGLAFTLAALWFTFSGPKTDSSTSGTVVDTSTSYSHSTKTGSNNTSSNRKTCGYTAAYKINEKSYTVKTNSSDSSWCKLNKGSKVEVKYLASDPAVSKTGDHGIIVLVFLVMGLAILVVGIAQLLRIIFKSKQSDSNNTW